MDTLAKQNRCSLGKTGALPDLTTLRSCKAAPHSCPIRAWRSTQRQLCDRNHHARLHHHAGKPDHSAPSRTYSHSSQARWRLV